MFTLGLVFIMHSMYGLVSFIFLGYTLMHPSLTRPYLLSEPPLHTDIIHYENIPKFELVRQNILRYEVAGLVLRALEVFQGNIR